MWNAEEAAAKHQKYLARKLAKETKALEWAKENLKVGMIVLLQGTNSGASARSVEEITNFNIVGRKMATSRPTTFTDYPFNKELPWYKTAIMTTNGICKITHWLGTDNRWVKI